MSLDRMAGLLHLEAQRAPQVPKKLNEKVIIKKNLWDRLFPMLCTRYH
jgi:hypothetical protein